MSMHRRSVLLLSGALTAASIAGCLASDTETSNDDSSSSDQQSSNDQPSPTEVSVDDDRLQELTTGNASFALDLYKQLSADHDNLFLSPFSISVALAMTFAGAQGETREQMQQVLAFTLGDDVHPAFADLQAELKTRESTIGRDPSTDSDDEEEIDAFQLAVANALWGQEGYGFADDYLSLIEENYGGGLREVDYAHDHDGARDQINDWVAEHTNDRIDPLLPETALSPQSVLVLTNAIYFLASWLHEFDPSDTTDDAFIGLDEEEATVPMMQQNLRTNYAKLANGEAIELPYVGQEVSMVLIKPDDGYFEQFEEELHADRLLEIFDELGDASGTLVLPKFEYSTDIQLRDTMQSMGMEKAFAGGFGGMVDGDGGGLAINEIFHEAFISVDEEGTEAAAATAVEMVISAPPDWGEVRFDRPFIFCIRDRPTDAILFLGRVVELPETS